MTRRAFALIDRSSLSLSVVESRPRTGLAVSLTAYDPKATELSARITVQVLYPWVWDQDAERGRFAAYMLAPPEPWMLALGAVIWEGIVQGASWDAVRAAASAALARLRAAGLAPSAKSGETTRTWKTRMAVELGFSRTTTTADEELVGRLFFGLRMSYEAEQAHEPPQARGATSESRDRGASAAKATPPNQALKLTRLSGCLLGGPGFGEDRGVRRSCPSSAVQLSAGVRLALGFSWQQWM